jgi:hypothetical protein
MLWDNFDDKIDERFIYSIENTPKQVEIST